MNDGKVLLVGPAPFIHAPGSTASLAWGCSIALTPALAWGVYSFGGHAFLVVLTSIAAALAGEALIGLVRKRFSLSDGSAFLSGFLLGLAMPPGVSLAIPAAASLFAMVVVKGAFGGLGSNWMNPALAGLAFSLVNWPREMGTWLLPRHLAGVEGVSGATPLGFLRARLQAGMGGGDPLGMLGAGGFQFTETDARLTSIFNGSLFGHFGAELPPGYLDLLIGNRPGSIGELSGLLLLLASVYLIARRSVRWQIPLAIFASNGLLVWIFGGLAFGGSLFTGDVLFSTLSGSFILVAFFMATDPVSSPSGRGNSLIYGLGIGTLTFLLRSFGSLPEGTAFAVIIMNCFVPLLDRGRGLPKRAMGALE